MNHIPISARLWAALCHLTITIGVLIFFRFGSPFSQRLFALLPSGASICSFKPHPICEDRNLIGALIILNLIQLIFFWSLQFFNILVTFSLWRLKKNNHDFINKHGKEALSFQFKCAIFTIFANLTIFIVLSLPLVLSLASVDELILRILPMLTMLVLLNLIFFLALSGIQFLLATILILAAFRGVFIRYKDI